MYICIVLQVRLVNVCKLATRPQGTRHRRGNATADRRGVLLAACALLSFRIQALIHFEAENVLAALEVRTKQRGMIDVE